VKVAAAPAEMDCDVGLADKENSELLPPLPEPFTVRRGEITQPFAMKNSAANSSANLRMNPLFPPTLTDDSLLPANLCAPNLCPGTFALEPGCPESFRPEAMGRAETEDNFIGLSGTAQVFAGWRQEMVKS
jgi:hypothetical protein